METLSIRATQHAPQTIVLKVLSGVAAALAAALLMGALLGGDWTLPMDPSVAAAFTA